MTVKIDITIDDDAWTKARLNLSKTLPAVLDVTWRSIPKRPKIKPVVSILLTSDSEIKKINKKYRSKNKPTNVLSFPQYDAPFDLSPSRDDILLGDIVVAFETVKREAQDSGISLKSHFTHMMVHGFLHLMGYDHMNEDEAEAMESLEIKILVKMNISNPYHDA